MMHGKASWKFGIGEIAKASKGNAAAQGGLTVPDMILQL